MWLNPTLRYLPEASEGYPWGESQAQQLSFLLEAKYHYAFSNPLETPLNSTFQSFQRTLFFHRISVARVWTSGFCWSPVLLCVLWGWGHLLCTSQMWNGWVRRPAPNKHHLPTLVPCCAFRPYTSLDFFNPKLFSCLNLFKTLFSIIFLCILKLFSSFRKPFITM